MLHVRYFCINKASFYVSWISWRSLDCHKIEVNLVTPVFWDIAEFKTVVAVCELDFLDLHFLHFIH